MLIINIFIKHPKLLLGLLFRENSRVATEQLQKCWFLIVYTLSDVDVDEILDIFKRKNGHISL